MMNLLSRRDFIAAGAAFASIGATSISSLAAGRRSLVPEKPGTTAGYLNTWHAQYYLAASRLKTNDLSKMMGADGSKLSRAELTEANLLGPGGMADACYPEVRKDLYFVLDDGWDVPPDGDLGMVGSLELDLARFPSFHGTPEQRLTDLNRAFQKRGWKTAGLWIAAQVAPAVSARDKAAGKDVSSPQYSEDYWIERLRWSNAAGIRYWKVDWGKNAAETQFRVHLSELAQHYAPDLVMEQTLPRGPLNGYFERNGSSMMEGRVSDAWVAQSLPLLCLSGTFRTYDTLPFLAVPTTLDRVAALLASVQENPKATTVLNTQDEVYIGAVLECELGMMRQAINTRGSSDVSDQSPRHVQRRLTEVVRAVRWQRIAPPVAAGEGRLNADVERLEDMWKFSAGETWLQAVIGKEIKQSAPARIARNMALPEVKSSGIAPFVLASRHPNGSLAVGTIGRMSSTKGWLAPRAAVSIEGATAGNSIGIFGRYESLHIKFQDSLDDCHVRAQDLADDNAHDITASVKRDGAALEISGELIDRLGTSPAAKADNSEPGIVLYVQRGRNSS